MGREVAKLCKEGYRGAKLSLGVDINTEACDGVCVYPSFDKVPTDAPVDCIVDFSHHSCAGSLLTFAKERNLPVVLATTGHTDEEKAEIVETAKQVPVFFSANMSLGIALLVELAKITAAAMPEADIEIIEKHHNRKLDAPSGTALMLANAICETRQGAYTNCGRSGQGKRTPEEIGIHAVRMGNIVGEHEVIVGTANQTLTLKHEAHSRALFAEGALAAAAFMCGKSAGLYDMNSLVSGEAAES